MSTLNPALKVEIAFVPNPFASSLTWTDVSQWAVLEGVGPINVRYGRNLERNANEPAQMTGLALLNTDGIFDSINQQTNLLTDSQSSFEDGTTGGWSPNANNPISAVTTGGLVGPHALADSVIANVSARQDGPYHAGVASMPNGTVFTYSMWVYSTQTFKAGAAVAVDSSSTRTFGTVTSVAAGRWTKLSVTATMDATSTITIFLSLSQATAGQVILMDAHWVVTGKSTPSPFSPYLLPLRPLRLSATDSYTVTDVATTNTSTRITSVTAFFDPLMASVGYTVTGAGIPANTTIASIPATTITSGSNGAALPQGTINVTDTSAFATSGTVTVVTDQGVQTVSYTGKTSTTFTGCTGGSGTMSTGGAVSTNTQATLSAAATATASNVSTTFAHTWPVFYGYITQWPQTWQDGTDGVAIINAVDAMTALFDMQFNDPYDTFARQQLGLNADVNSSWGFWTMDSTTPPAAETGYMSPSGSGPSNFAQTSGAVASQVTAKDLYGIQFTKGGLAASLDLTSVTASATGEMIVRVDATPSPLPGMIQWLLCSFANGNTSQMSNPNPFGDFISPMVVPAVTSGNKPTVSAGGGLSLGWWKPLANVITDANVSEMLTDATGWVTTDGTISLARDTGQLAPQGGPSTSLKITAGGAGSTTWGVTTAAFITGITAGHTYAVNLRGSTGSATAVQGNLNIAWYDSGGTLLSTAIQISGNHLSDQQRTGKYFWSSIQRGTAVAPTNAVKCKLTWTNNSGSSMAAGVSQWITAVMLYDVTAANSAVSGLPGTPTFDAVSVPYTKPSDTAVRFFAITPGVTLTSDNLMQIITTSLPAVTVAQWYLLTWATANITGSTGTDFIRFTPVGGGSNVDIDPLLAQTYNVTDAALINFTSITIGATNQDLQFSLDDVYLARWGYTGVTNLTTANAATRAAYVARNQVFPQQTTGARISGVLDAINFPAGQRNIDTGLSTITASGNLSGSAALSQLQAAAQAELGNFWADPSGTAQFRDRSKRNNATVAATYGENDAEIHYEDDLGISRDYLFIYNDISVTQQGASPAYMSVAQDQTSIGTTGNGPAYGVRSLQLSAPLVNKADVDGMAATLLAWYKDSRSRIAQITFKGRANRKRVPQMFGRSIGDLVTANKRPAGAAMISVNTFIDGVQHTISRDDWTTVFYTTPQFPNTTY